MGEEHVWVLRPNRPRAGQPTAPAEPARPTTSTTSVVKPARPGTYAIQPGDTFSKIAKTQLGDASRWREIAALNPTVDVRMLRIGMELKLPQ